MREHKKGARVLLERVALDDESNGYIDVGAMEGLVETGHVHAHPGVPVAALVEELEILTRKDRMTYQELLSRAHGDEWSGADELRLAELRAAREAAKEPELKEGQEGWVRVVVTETFDPAGSHLVRASIPGTPELERLSFLLRAADIRTTDPTGEKP